MSSSPLRDGHKKKWRINMEGYKTVVFFVLALVIGVANALGFADFQMSAEQAEWFAVVVPLAGLLLRFVTKTEIFKKSK
jgi:hypothetical protein